MKVLTFVVGFFRRLLLLILALFWLSVAYELFKRGPNGFLHWFFATTYQNTLIPYEVKWRPVVIAVSVYCAITVLLAVWEWRSIKASRPIVDSRPQR